MAYNRRGKAAAKGSEGATPPVTEPAAAATPAQKVSFFERIKLLPVLIFLAVMLVGVKVNGLWQSYATWRSPVSIATYAEAEPLNSSRSAEREQLAQASKSDGKSDATPEKPLDPVLFTRSEIELLQELSKRRKELDEREESIIQQEGLLNAAEDRIEKKIAELQGIKAKIEGLIKKYEEQEEKQFKSLVQIYEKMKPKDAARIFNELDIAILLQVFERMKSAKSAPILAGMRPQRAKEITTRIAARKAMPKIN